MLALTGCGAKLAQLKSQVSSDLGCSQESIDHEDLGQWRERVSCSGREMIYAYDEEEEKWKSALDRATFDLSCPKNELQATVIDSQTVGVTGCGQKATFVLNTTMEPTYMGFASKHTWVMNSDIKESE